MKNGSTDKEALTDYFEKERSLFETFLRHLADGRCDENTRYPPLSRFPRINHPIARAIPWRSSIYPIIPFYGTTIVPIYPCPKRDFETFNGFSPDDIDRIVDFIKDTGKLQFTLTERPSKYESIDFLDPLFDVLKPPVDFLIPYEYSVDRTAFKKFGQEFQTVAGFGFTRYIVDGFMRKGCPADLAYDIIVNNSKDYAFAKCLGYSDLTNLIDTMLMEDYISARKLLAITTWFISSEFLSPLRLITNYSKEILAWIHSGISYGSDAPEEYEPTVGIPFEIGRFLIRKMTFMPGDFEACKDIIGYYDQSDLHRLLTNLETGIKDGNVDAIAASRKELDTILDNLWQDANSIRNRMKTTEVGIPFGLAVVGTLAVDL